MVFIAAPNAAEVNLDFNAAVCGLFYRVFKSSRFFVPGMCCTLRGTEMQHHCVSAGLSLAVAVSAAAGEREAHGKNHN